MIHKTAIIHPSSELDSSVHVGAYSIIEEKYIEAFKNKEKYNFDYLKSLIYIKNDQKIGNQELIQRLPLI